MPLYVDWKEDMPRPRAPSWAWQDTPDAPCSQEGVAPA